MKKRNTNFDCPQELEIVLSRFFKKGKVRTIENLCVFLNKTPEEYQELKEDLHYTRTLDFAELQCKESVMDAGFSGQNFASYYHKEYYSDVPDVVDSRDIVINIQRDETVSPHLGLLDE